MTGSSQSADTPETARPWEAHPPLPEEDADTGPIRVVALDDEVTREVPLPHLPQPDQGWPASYQPPPAETYASRFTAPLSVTPRPVSVRRTGIHPGVVAAGVAGVALVALAAWLLWPAGGEGGQDPVVAAPTTTVDAEAQDELLGFLPPGYPSNACTPADDPKEAAAVVDCKKNADTGGPTSATYSLFADADGLVGAFDDVVARLDVVNCPGNIQSPVLCPTGVSNAFGDSGR